MKVFGITLFLTARGQSGDGSVDLGQFSRSEIMLNDVNDFGPTEAPEEQEFEEPEFAEFAPMARASQLANDLSCFHCNAKNFTHCEEIGEVKQCLDNEETCMIELRKRDGIVEGVRVEYLRYTARIIKN